MGVVATHGHIEKSKMAAISLKMAIMSFLFVTEGSFLNYFFISRCFGVTQSIEDMLSFCQKIQYGHEDGYRSEYYSNSVQSYPREILLVSFPMFSRLLNTMEQHLLQLDGYLIVKFKVK